MNEGTPRPTAASDKQTQPLTNYNEASALKNLCLQQTFSFIKLMLDNNRLLVITDASKKRRCILASVWNLV